MLTSELRGSVPTDPTRRRTGRIYTRRNTLEALSRLRAHEVISAEEHEQCLRAYLFLRRVVDRLCGMVRRQCQREA